MRKVSHGVGRRLLTMLLGVVTAVSGASAVRAQAVPPVWQPQIAIVWPQDGQGHQTSVAQSRAINVSVWPSNAVSCNVNLIGRPSGTSDFSLWLAKGDDPVEQVATPPTFLGRMVGGVRFPSVEYDGIPADLAGGPGAKYALVAGLSPVGSNVWVHAADPRTYYPQPVVPVGYGTLIPGQIDSRIQIVWPHDAQGRYTSVEQADYVNIAVEFFQHGTLLSVDPQPDTLDFLRVAVGNQMVDAVRTPGQHPLARRTTYVVGRQTYPRWIFNDVPVQPGQQCHFMAPVYFGKILSPYTSIWTHAADARTVLPAPQAPPQCIS